jgi:RimJ/RimL family protein N-acetyltransferase
MIVTGKPLLTIRDATADDADNIAEIFGGLDRSDFDVSGMQTEAEAFDLAEMLPLVAAGYLGIWIVEDGDRRPMSLQLFQRLGFPGVWTFSAVTVPNTGSRGLGTAACALAIDKLFDNPDARRLTGFVAVTADGPKRLCEKLGFVFEGMARQQIALRAGVWVDAWTVGMLAPEWKIRRHTVATQIRRSYDVRLGTEAAA